MSFFLWECTTIKTTKIDSTANTQPNSGVLYTLPKTALRVNVSISKEIKMKGPYADFAEKLLGLKNVISSNQTSYRITDISLDPFSIQDTSHQYLITISKNPFHRHFDRYLFNSNGQLLAYNSKVAGIDDKKLVSAKANITNSNANYPNFFQLYADASQIEKIDTVYETIKTDTITMSKPIIKRTLVTKTVEQRAVEAADYILKFRMKRYELISASQEIPYSKDAIEYMNNQLLKMENDYLELFVGISRFENIQTTYTVVPNATLDNRTIPLFGFSETSGIVDYNDSKANKYSLSFEPSTKQVEDSVHLPRLNQIPYRFPDIVNVFVNINGERLSDFFQLPIYQYGIVRFFPKRVKSFTVDPNSGTITKIKVK